MHECFQKYSTRAPDHTTIIIDEADLILQFSGCDNLILALIHMSWEDVLFKVMFCVSDPHNAASILNLNGRTKIELIGQRQNEPALFARWTKDEINMFAVDQYSFENETVLQRVVELGAKAGTPKIFSDIMESGGASDFRPHHEITAAIWDERWRSGAVIVNTRKM